MRYAHLVPLILTLAFNGLAVAQDSGGTAQEAHAVLSPTFRACFGKDAPLNAASYGCLDREYRRLNDLLTKEYRAALARQVDDASRDRLTRDERMWWRIRFNHCRDEVGDLNGSTARVVNESCEIDTLAERIVKLRHYGP
jgi:uncharacterized protein YecT (DUF1311 family)